MTGAVRFIIITLGAALQRKRKEGLAAAPRMPYLPRASMRGQNFWGHRGFVPGRDRPNAAGLGRTPARAPQQKNGKGVSVCSAPKRRDWDARAARSLRVRMRNRVLETLMQKIRLIM